LYTGSSDGVVLRWDPATGKELGALALKGSAVGYTSTLAALSPDGTRALGYEGGSALGVYDLPAGTQQFVLPGDLNRNSRGAFTADGTKVVQVLPAFDPKAAPSRVDVWDVATAKKLGAVEVPDTRELNAALSPDGKTLATVALKRGEKGTGEVVVTGWELATGKKLAEYVEPNQGFGAAPIAFAGDNKSAVVMSPREGPILVDVVAGAKTRALEGAASRTGAAPVVAPDGKTVAVATGAGFGPKASYSVVLIDLETGKVKKTLAGLTSPPSALAFSADGKTLLTGCGDTTALVWDVGGP
jgi:WD40 repeat protein